MAQIKTKDSAPRKVIRANIRDNTCLIDKWVSFCKKTTDTAYLVSAGPSLKRHAERLKEIQKDPTNKIFCVKHALPTLLEAGIIPFGCITLDPRPLDGVSTHGVLRSDCFEEVPFKTLFFFASMTHPSQTEWIKKRGGKVVGWHAHSDNFFSRDEIINSAKERKDQEMIQRMSADMSEENNESLLPKGHPLITSGSCSSSRAIGLLQCLGFYKITLVGFDLCLEEKPLDIMAVEPNGNPKYVGINLETPEGKKIFWTTPELAANAEDLEHFFKNDKLSVEFDVWEDCGVSSALWANFKASRVYPTYLEMLQQ